MGVFQNYPDEVEGAPSDQRDLLEITVGRARLAVARRGVGGTPHMVFLHTGISDLRSWDEVSALLSPDMDVVAYDRRGFGVTAYRAERHDQVGDLLAVLDGLGLDDVVLVGNSRGGQIALDFTLAHPTRVSALVLVAPAVTGAPAAEAIEPVEAAIWETLEAAEAAGALDALNLGEIRLWVDGPYGPEGRVGGAARDLALDMNRIALRAADPGQESEPPDAWSRLSEVRCPVLVVAGDLDLAHIRARAEELASRIPGGRFAVMAGAAHLPGLEQPVAFAAVLRDFLGDLSGRPAG
jgi:pimeloyl-ACP methyl ester carboxylesterase